MSRYGVNPTYAGRLPTVLTFITIISLYRTFVQYIYKGLHRYESIFLYRIAAVSGRVLSGLEELRSPGKGLRYLRTIIVIAGVHQRLGRKLPRPKSIHLLP
jgi:uncharacterized membrane protein YfhO